MKYNLKRKIQLNLTLDSSEAIMFTKGGMHKVTMKISDLLGKELEDYEDQFMIEDQDIEITVQMERSEQGRFDFIKNTAQHYQESDNENKNI